MMTWQQFKQQLQANPDLHLQFQYAENSMVAPSYHITEIKQANITSVDCGGVMNNWAEVIVQLWEPDEVQQERAMTVDKALSIVDLVEKALPLAKNAIVKIEFGNAGFATRQLLPNAFIVNGTDLIVDLSADSVQCKAINRGGSCGTTANGEECCTPVAEKPKVKLINLATPAASCAPGSGCC